MSHCHRSPSGRVVLLNEINELDFRSTLKLLMQARKWTRHCQVLMISMEDIRPSEYDNFRRLTGREIWIRRNPLEIISSRYHNINQKANLGIGWSRQSCDQYFLNTLRELMNEKPLNGAVWHYNQWLQSPEWRSEFLSQNGFSYDEMPAHSPIGGGSSFHGTSGKIESKIGTRLEKVRPSHEWRAFLNNLIEESDDLFTHEELNAAKSFLKEENSRA